MLSAMASQGLGLSRPTASAPPCLPRALGACSPAESSGASSSSRAARRRQPQQQHRQQRLLAAAQEQPQLDIDGEPIGPGEIGLLGVPGEDFDVHEMPDGIEGRAGYTPYDFIDFTDIPLKHEVVVRVEKPIGDVYGLWAQRVHWPDWFSMIEEVGFREGDPDACALNMWYRWAMTPWLQLYVALRRTQAEPNKYLVEEPEDGAPLVAAVLFQEDGPAATLVTLRISYLLPRVLYEFAGATAVYGDVDRKLQRCMEKMQEMVEGADCAALLAGGEAKLAEIRQDLPEHMRRQQEYDAQWAAEKQRRQQQLEQQQQAAADAEAAALPIAAAAAAEAEAAAAVEAAAAAQRALPPPPKKRGRKMGSGAAAQTVASGKGRRGKAKAESSE